jgi:hypothetical protein
MTKFSRASAALALAASAALAGAAKADEGTTYYYTDDTTTGAYSDRFAPSANYYDSNPVVVAPTPQIYYAPVYTERSNTTYYHSGATHDGYVSSSPAYRTYYEPRVVYTPPATVYTAPPVTTYSYSQPSYQYAPPPPYGYTPPGLSITTPTGTYAPFYGGWNSYSMESNGYRIGR